MEAVTLLDLNRRISAMFATAAGLQGVWVTAETADLRVSGGHCYFEMVQKDPGTGVALARGRAVIWASQYARLGARFREVTGASLQSNIKVMARVNVTYHPVYGMSMAVIDINPEYTVGDIIRRRNEMVARLRSEGIIDMNRTLTWAPVVQRVAVVSARGAAGYGDFIHQLYSNPYCLRFAVRLFPAAMQGERTAREIISALDCIAAQADSYDCVVIIRGGGAGADLASFDDYDLAANIAQFPLPVIVGIGHERDVTLLDYVANMRVKTPTAAAEWLIGHGADCLQRMRDLGGAIFRTVSDRLSGNHRQLAYISGQLPALAMGVVERNRQRLSVLASGEVARLSQTQISRRRERLDSIAALVEALSPQATLRRGYSVTRLDGVAVTDPADLRAGDVIETLLAGGTVRSQIVAEEKS